MLVNPVHNVWKDPEASDEEEVRPPLVDDWINIRLYIRYVP